MNHTTDTNSSLSFRPFETMRIISRMQPLDFLPDWNEFGSKGKNSISGVFANKGEVLGYVQHVGLKSEDTTIWYTISLEVQEGYRGQGIATALITASMSDTIELTFANRQSEGVFKRCGFDVKAEFDFGYKLMAKNISGDLARRHEPFQYAVTGFVADGYGYKEVKLFENWYENDWPSILSQWE